MRPARPVRWPAYVYLAAISRALPTEEGVGRDDGGDAGEEPAAQWCALGCEASALFVGQAQAAAAEGIVLEEVRMEHVVQVIEVCVPSLEGGANRLGQDRSIEAAPT
jgi:hypothetical protein